MFKYYGSKVEFVINLYKILLNYDGIINAKILLRDKMMRTNCKSRRNMKARTFLSSLTWN